MPPKRQIVDEAEELVCKFNAEGMSARRIQAALKVHNYFFSHQAIWQYLTNVNNLPTIEKHRDLYRSNPLSVDLAHKKIRLLDYNRERLRIIKSIGNMCGDKDDVLGEIPKKGWSRYTTLLKRLIEIEKEGREEVERKPDLVALFQRIGPFSEVSDAELDRQAKIIDQKLLVIRGGGGITPQKVSDIKGEGKSVKEKPA